MKITKYGNQAINESREFANHGCHKCPCCGETRDLFDVIVDTSKIAGIDSITVRKEKGFFSIKFVSVERYHCYTCGAEWESDEWT